MGRVKANSLRLREAAEMLELSYRQAKRIWARYREEGAKALQHANCGRVSNRAYTGKFRAAARKKGKDSFEDLAPAVEAAHLGRGDGLVGDSGTLRRWVMRIRGRRRDH